MSFRIDRLATLYVAEPLRRVASNGITRIPILMYHSIAEEDESGVAAYYRTATSPSSFQAQMAAIRNAGYTTIGVPEAVRLLKGESKHQTKSLVITFDDGYRNFYANAFPILERFGFTATMYLPTAHIGDSSRQFKGKECMSWSEIRELNRLRISFGSHTVNHPQLHDLSRKAIKEELVVSKAIMDEKLGTAAESFAYPYAFPETDSRFKSDLRNMLLEAGYTCGVCTTVGLAHPASDAFFLERLPINSCDDQQLFMAKLRGSYDWIRKPQYFVKMAKNWGNSHASRRENY